MTAQRKKLLWRLFWVALLGLILAGVAAPFLSAERFAAPIRGALVGSLGREVEFSQPRFDLFRGPGFSIQDVVVREDPAFGSEPIAYVRSLEARIKVSSLLAGRLEFSHLRLVEPSVNLCRNQAGVWNSQAFFRAARGATWPTIQIRDGRVNLRLGEWKSVYYFSQADMDLYLNSESGGSLVLRFTGVPARTDRAAQSFGAMRGRLRWLPERDEGRLEAEVELERSSVGELVMLAHGEDVGVHGAVSGKVRLAGPPSAIQIAGELNIESLYRWDLAPAKTAGWPLRFRGVLNASDQRLDLDANRLDNPDLRLELRLRVADFLAAPRWAASFTALEMPLPPVVEAIAHLGSPVPKDVVTGGKVTGVIGYSLESGFRGQLKLDAVALRLPGQAAAHIEQARLLAAGGRFEMPPAMLRFDNAAALVDGTYDRLTRALNVRFNARALPLATLKNALGATVPAPLSKLVDAAGAGLCSGTLRLAQAGEAPGEWSADADVRNAKLTLAALAEPVLVGAAHVSVAGAKFGLSQIDARIGGIELVGQVAFQPGAERRYRMHLAAPRVDAGQLEALLAPALRRPQGFLQRTLHLGRPAPPPWLEDWRAEGVIEAATLTVDRLTFQNARFGFAWDGAQLEAKSVSASFENGALSGALSIGLGEAAPRYRFSGRVEDIRWRGGTSTVEGVAEASGTGAALLGSLRLKGSWRGESLALLAEKDVRALSARCEAHWRGGAPEFRFTDLLVRFPHEEVKGHGGSTQEGKLKFDLSGDGTRYQVRGDPSPLKLELVSER
jgi:AsmA protein